MGTPAEETARLLSTVPVAALSTLDAEGAPAASLVPFVYAAEPARLYLLVSELSAHTGALRRDPRCAVLIADPAREGDPRENHALARLSFRATARFVTRDEARERGAEELYSGRFPAMAPTLLGLSDFHFVELAPVVDSGSLVLGFGRAYALPGLLDAEGVTPRRA